MKHGAKDIKSYDSSIMESMEELTPLTHVQHLPNHNIFKTL